MSTTQALLAAIERFLKVEGMAPSTFGRKAVNDGKLVDRLRNGGSVTLPKARAIETFLKEHASTEGGRAPSGTSGSEAA